VLEKDPAISFSFATNQNVVSVPSSRDLVLLVQAPGYKRWFYFDAANPGQPTARFASGEERTVDAELEPVETKN
jgi:hypothetical protein